MVWARRIVVLAAAALLGAGAVADVRAGEPTLPGSDIALLRDRLLDDPTNTELNLQYALVAEGRGEARKALGTYERILLNDPGNAAARRGLLRVRRQLLPPETSTILTGGLRWEANPRHLAATAGDDWIAFARMVLTDERTLGSDTRWRTTLAAAGDYYFDNTDISYANLRFDTGPVLDLNETYRLHLAAGGAVSYYLEHVYGEAVASATLETFAGGAKQWLRVRAGYRAFDPFFTSDSGFFADAVAQATLTSVIARRDALALSPWVRWSNVQGSVFDVFGTEFAPSMYTEIGGRIEYTLPVASWLALGAGISLSERFYQTAVPGGGEQRRDFLVAPTARVVFLDLLPSNAALSVNYRYEWNDSNSDAQDYSNHAVSLAVTKRM